MSQIFNFLFEQYRGYAFADIVLEITAVIFGFASVWYSKKNNILVFPTGLISTSIFVYLLFKWQLIGDMLINGYYFIMSLYGWYIWTRKVDSEHVTPISKTTKRELNWKVEINVKYIVTTPVLKEVNENSEKQGFLNNKLEVGDKITLDNILFKTGYSYLENESVPVLEKIAEDLRERDDIYFTIQGHVCCTKNARDAVDRKTGKRNLSLARAKFIYDYLVQQGIKRTRMRYVGLKNKHPLGKAKKYDKRVEIKITSISKKI